MIRLGDALLNMTITIYANFDCPANNDGILRFKCPYRYDFGDFLDCNKFGKRFRRDQSKREIEIIWEVLGFSIDAVYGKKNSHSTLDCFKNLMGEIASSSSMPSMEQQLLLLE